MNKIIINTEYISLSQFMKMESLVQSGGEAKQVIQQGLVSVNNEICTQRGRKLYKDDIIEFNGIEYIIN
ncbi:MAG: RNA-binding S4 domain-containing protein [Epulopiscium sp.]|nr:RNA-binding S4 domain-containing protein [Candidatus Epulonipiscium sp.]